MKVCYIWSGQSKIVNYLKKLLEPIFFLYRSNVFSYSQSIHRKKYDTILCTLVASFQWWSLPKRYLESSDANNRLHGLIKVRLFYPVMLSIQRKRTRQNTRPVLPSTRRWSPNQSHFILDICLKKIWWLKETFLLKWQFLSIFTPKNELQVSWNPNRPEWLRLLCCPSCWSKTRPADRSSYLSIKEDLSNLMKPCNSQSPNQPKSKFILTLDPLALLNIF